VFQGNPRPIRAVLRLTAVFLLAGLATFSADPPLVPLGVCEVLRDLPAHDGKNVAVIGRYSFRETGRSLGEQACDPPLEVQTQLSLVEDVYRGPKPPGNFELDGVAVNRKLAQIRRRTTLGKFRFGTPDYDRWAVVYGEVKLRQGDDAKKTPANLVFRGDGVVLFLTPDQ
jgi:hypothetical protein